MGRPAGGASLWGFTDYSVRLGDGGRLFRGGGEIAIVVRVRGWCLGIRHPRGIRRRGWGPSGHERPQWGRGRRGRSHCRAFGFLRSAGGLPSFSRRWGVRGPRSSPVFFYRARIFAGSSSVGLGYFRAWEVAIGDRSAGEASSWGVDIFLIGAMRDGLARSGGIFVCFRERLSECTYITHIQEL